MYTSAIQNILEVFMGRKVVLAGACRTAIGTMGGTLSNTPAPELGTVVIKEALKRTGINPEQVDEVYMGCVIQAGLGQNPARQSAINAGIPVEVIRAKNSGYSQPPLNHATDAIWDRVRKAGLSSPEQAIRSGLFTPDEVRYITENDLWRYR
jgi:acetyl-CoA acetyltransferase